MLWLLLWFVLSRVWSGRPVAAAKISALALLSLGAGLLLSFPPIGDRLRGR